jgi:hypothetical protein
MAFVNNLSKWELEYEIKIRGVVLPTDSTLEKCRSILRGLVVKQKLRTTKPIENNFSRTLDLEQIAMSLKDVETLLSNLDTPIEKAISDKINDRLRHISERLNRVHPKTDDSLEDDFELFETELYSLIGEFEQIKELDKSSQVQVLNTSTIEPLANSSNISTQPSNSKPPVAPVVTFKTPSSNTSADVIHKWNVKFKGNPGTLLDFLEKVEDLRIARNISEDCLFNSAYDLFDAEALQWFRSNRSRVQSWSELVALLKSCFLPFNLDSEINRELTENYQQITDNVSVFISKSKNLFARLVNPPPEIDRVNLIREHLLPFFIEQTSTLDFNTVDELNDLCVRLEKSRICSNRAGQLLAPRRSQPLRAAVSMMQQPSNAIKCWNCSGPHNFKICTKPKMKFFCFRCGTPNVTIIHAISVKKT